MHDDALVAATNVKSILALDEGLALEWITGVILYVVSRVVVAIRENLKI